MYAANCSRLKSRDLQLENEYATVYEGFLPGGRWKYLDHNQCRLKIKYGNFCLPTVQC
jgi:hypothetical protein